ncbi:hypothetical protein RDI58_017563 [Solanum bulbocastanum]|uniref:Uncharacterized protein n=1 Tax=Solanum bulbocastanum TaxID=147425 RepID=A0AAN8TA33_SOLBU
MEMLNEHWAKLKGLTIAAKNFLLLEELSISITEGDAESVTKDDAESVDRYYPLLKSLILNNTSFDLVGSPVLEDNNKALTITKNMSEL